MGSLKYRSRVIRVTAWQYQAGESMPAWVYCEGRTLEDGTIVFKRGVAWVPPNPGDWLVRDEAGNVGVFEDAEFKRAFEEDVA